MSSTAQSNDGATVSQRGLRLGTPVSETSYLQTASEIATDLWSPENPTGVVSLAVAENIHVGHEAMAVATSAINKRGHHPWVPLYGDFRGHPRLRQAIVDHLARHVLVDRGATLPSEELLQADDLLVSNGCGSALEHLLFALIDPGDAVLTPAPIYPGFVMDVTCRAEGHLATFPVPIDRSPRLDRAGLDAASLAAQQAGHPPRALLLASPYNPLGVCWSLDELALAVQWCADHDVHLISDEIYAASVFSSSVRFSSAFALARMHPEWARDRLHLLYGFSKDLGLSGLRAGVIGSRNTEVHQALDGLMYFCGCSNATQDLLLGILDNPTRRDGLLARNRSTLARLAATVASALGEVDVPLVPTQAGFFTWIDLRRWLPEATAEGEATLFRSLVDRAHVLLTPGLACRAPAPGYFRLCFAAVPEDGLDEGMHRLVRFLKTAAV